MHALRPRSPAFFACPTNDVFGRFCPGRTYPSGQFAPMHSDLSAGEVEHVAEAVLEVVATTANAGGATSDCDLPERTSTAPVAMRRCAARSPTARKASSRGG